MLVVAGALYDTAGRVLITQRPAGKPLEGRWEFPGGKVAPGEPEAGALARELREELGIRVEACEPLLRLVHDYPERRVHLSLWIVQRYRGVPGSLEGQALKWVAPAELAAQDILEADLPFIAALCKLGAPGSAV